MEIGEDLVLGRTGKRKFTEICVEDSRFLLQELNQDLLEIVLSWLPTSSFLRLTSVCKKWKSVADSATFRLACSQVRFRDPWFFMVDSDPHRSQHPVVFDSAEKKWKKLNPLPLVQPKKNQESCSNFIPVAASGGLICFHSTNGDFTVSNPVTGSTRLVPALTSISQQPILAISMTANSERFKLVLIMGQLPNLSFKKYDSSADQWEDEIPINQKIKNSGEVEKDDDHHSQYFLSSDNVVSADMQRNPYRQYSSALTVENGEEILYFLSSSGTVVSCNLTHKLFFEYPRLLPVFSEYSIDIVECGGQMYVVLLSEFFESASIRVWKWDENMDAWKQIAAMPPASSHKFYGKKVDINCCGAGDEMLVCLNSAEVCTYVMCNLVRNEWIELPQCYTDEDKTREFVCAFSFEPRIEADI
ncbi:F-box only protein 13 [Dorcoceras hygrometricum]|uniref:F-box only protein 13 n=1 Tax=Dorcoceras hygrometricum TaxID=472368 RepID=A0A2Z7BWP2_9LAMI|nr:F-box only protein 13 [Dorcoceras hygrometricum]